MRTPYEQNPFSCASNYGTKQADAVCFCKYFFRKVAFSKLYKGGL